MQHLIKNVAYEGTEGRLQLLQVLNTIVEKLPADKLVQWQDLLFITLFLRLVNEQSHKCRETVTNILKALVKKSSKKYADAIW